MAKIENMTAVDIVSLLQEQGVINVSWRYRDFGARRKMHNLVSRGLIKKGYCGKGSDSFLPL